MNRLLQIGTDGDPCPTNCIAFMLSTPQLTASLSKSEDEDELVPSTVPYLEATFLEAD